MAGQLAVVGDIHVSRRAPEDAFSGLAEVLTAADIRFGNLEGPLDGGSLPSPEIPHKPNWTHPAPEMLPALTAGGFDVVSCANNVSYPPQSVMRSVALLKDAGIAPVGAGGDLNEARRPAIVERAGVRWGFLARTALCAPFGMAATRSTAGVARLRALTAYAPDPRVAEVPGRPPTVMTWPHADDLSDLVEDIRSLKSQCDVVVMSCHWGITDQPICDYQRAVARAAINAGADVIAGHGPHSLQPIEIYQGRPIFYSLGSAIMDWKPLYGDNSPGLVATVNADDRGVRQVNLRMLCRDKHDRVAPIGDEAIERILGLIGPEVNLSRTTGAVTLDLSR